MRIHFLVNPSRLDAVLAAIEAISFVRARGVEVAAERQSAAVLDVPVVDREGFGEADLVVCFGGDGTLIRASDLCSAQGTPVLGVYFGRFGFVTQCQDSELVSALERFFAGDIELEERMMLQVQLLRAGQQIAELHALNEMAFQRAPESRMMTFSVSINGTEVTSYPADGLLASTPTGSTAYNLSAGGPILDPRVQAIVFSAIAPHTLSARPLILSPEAVLELRAETAGEATVSVDGLSHLHAMEGDIVRVCRSPRVTRLVLLDHNDFLRKLGQRLFWSYSVMGAEHWS